MLEFLRLEGTVVVTDLTRLSLSTKDFIEITEQISHKGAYLKSLNESWIQQQHMEKCCLLFSCTCR